MVSSKLIYSLFLPLAFSFPSYVSAETGNQSVIVTAGYQYTQGKYNQDVDTTFHYVPISALVSRDNWQFELTVPYIMSSGNGTVLPGAGGPMFSGGSFNSSGSGGGMFNPSNSTSTVTNSGLGDIIARAVYSFDNYSTKKLYYQLEANIKFGTASAAQALGTGENDYAIQLNTSYGFETTTFGNFGYKVMGDSAAINYNNVLFATAGLSFKMEGTARFGFSLDYQQTTVNGLDDFQQANVFISWIQDKRTISLNALTGLTNSSPDFGASIYISSNY